MKKNFIFIVIFIMPFLYIKAQNQLKKEKHSLVINQNIPLKIGFDFPFNKKIYDFIFVSKKGYLTFDENIND